MAEKRRPREHLGEPVFDREVFSRAIRVRLAELNISYRTAAPEIGVSVPTLHRTAINRGLPDIETYLRLCAWLRATGGLAEHLRPTSKAEEP